MKRILCLILTLMCVLPLAACANVSPIPGLNNGIEGDADAVKALEDELKELKKSYDAKIKQLNSQIEALEEEEAAQNAKIEVLETDKRKKAQEIAALKNTIEALKAEYEERISALEERLESTTDPDWWDPNDPWVDDDPFDNDVTTDPDWWDPEDPDEDLEVHDLEGYVYKAYVRVNSGNEAFYCEDFWVENSSADALPYAVYDRNQQIEDTYNCRIRQYDSDGDQYAAMTRFYFNDEYYSLSILLGTHAATCATTNLLQDVYNLNNIDLTHSTYDQNSIKGFTMGGKLYFLSGDMNISPLDSAAVTIFNPDLFNRYDFVEELDNESYDDLYEMVAEGKWTVSAMLEMAEIVYIDADNSGGTLVAADGDQVGYLSYSATPMFYWYGCGARVSELDEDGYPSLVFGSWGSNTEEVFNFLFSQINNQQSGNEWIPNGGGGYRNSEFMTDALLFTDIWIWDIRKVLYPLDKARYGILPIPKYNEEQSRYYDVVYFPYGTVHLWSIPAKCNNVENASFLFHVLSVYSSYPDGTMDAYYTKTLELSVARDAGSRATLKIVRDSLTYDIFLLYNWGGFIQSLIEGIDTAVSNEYGNQVTAANLDAAVADMELTLERYKNPFGPISSDADW